MKIIVLIGGGRTGIDFLQSLFDQHSEVSQLPGVFYFDEFWKDIKNERNLKFIIKKFTKDYKKFFDSRLNIMERHDMLGQEKNSHYIVSEDKFEKKFLEIFEDNQINKANLIKFIHLAYSAASGEKLNEKKIIILHLHHVYRLSIMKEIDYECIYTIRDPLASYTSLMKNWKNIKKNKQQVPSIYYYHINRMFNGLRDTLEFNHKTHVIRLEDLHIKNQIVMKTLCKKIEINYEDIMKKSTYHGKSWWGDKVSGRDINGVNPNFKNKIDDNLFFKKDIQCIEYYMQIFLMKYEYPFRSNKLKYFFYKYLPFKIEFKIWLGVLLSFNLKEIILIPFLWYKKTKIMSKKNYKDVVFPNSIG
jgi:hypothetical protein